MSSQELLVLTSSKAMTDASLAGLFYAFSTSIARNGLNLHLLRQDRLLLMYLESLVFPEMNTSTSTAIEVHNSHELVCLTLIRNFCFSADKRVYRIKDLETQQTPLDDE